MLFTQHVFEECINMHRTHPSLTWSVSLKELEEQRNTVEVGVIDEHVDTGSLT